MKSLLLLVFAALLLIVVPSTMSAQGGAKQGPQIMRDAELEKDSLHNLEVARHYFKLRKAFVAALQRCEEIMAANPAFSRIDEALFIAAQSSLNLSEGKGKQNASAYIIYEGETKKTLTAEEFRELARGYFSQLVNSYPESKFRSEAEDALRALGGGKAVSKQ
jgi:outer membrane protein assembly factor BamD (BamD/ComL family)